MHHPQVKICQKEKAEFSSAFKCIIPSQLVCKLLSLGIGQKSCSWVIHFLTYLPQPVQMGPHYSLGLTLIHLS